MPIPFDQAKKKMLEYLRQAIAKRKYDYFTFEPPEKDYQINNAIYRLIERGQPKVSMEQIERMAGRVHGIVLYKNTLKAIIEVFLELGFEIEEVPEKGKGGRR